MNRYVTMAFLLFILTMASVLAFPSDTTLGTDKHTPNANTFSVAGQVRTCSEYADKSGTFIGTKAVSSPVNPALINLYSCKNNDPQCDQGWTYIGEYEAPHTFTYSGKYMAYEIYYCPETAATCATGDTRPVTETSYQSCQGGSWGPTKQCGNLQYFDPEAGACVFRICQEAWTCSAWGDCTSGGNQYRSCTDTNRCGTYKGAPKTQQTCTPKPSDGAATPSAWKANPPVVMIGQPTIDGNVFAVKAGDEVIVRQKFQVNTAGSYWIEAGLDQTKTFSVVDVKQNTCDPAETWYKNELENFPSTGIVEKTFNLVVPNNGEYVLHSAIVTGCGGDVLDQQNQVDRITAGAPNGPGNSSMVWGPIIVIVLIIGALVGVISLGVWAFSKKKR